MTTKQGIAEALKKVGEYGFSGIEVARQKPYDAFSFIMNKKLDSATMLRVYAEVKRQGLLEFHSSGNTTRLTITPFGANRLLAYTANTVTIPIMKKWDNKWRVVTYDIPKGKDKERVFLNRRLKELGFKMLNKSLWVHPYECEGTIGLITDYLVLTRYVKVFIVSKWDTFTDKQLHEKFKA